MPNPGADADNAGKRLRAGPNHRQRRHGQEGHMSNGIALDKDAADVFTGTLRLQPAATLNVVPVLVKTVLLGGAVPGSVVNLPYAVHGLDRERLAESWDHVSGDATDVLVIVTKRTL